MGKYTIVALCLLLVALAAGNIYQWLRYEPRVRMGYLYVGFPSGTTTRFTSFYHDSTDGAKRTLGPTTISVTKGGGAVFRFVTNDYQREEKNSQGASDAGLT